jgi:sulfate/thiosulfate transport system ATP-binding protein
VLLLDEPFGALDAQVRKELRSWLRRLHDEVHVTTVFVTHDQEEAMDVADEIVVLADGRVQQIGSPGEIYDNPANAFVMGFLGPVTRLDGELIRPHDITLSREARPGTVPATVNRIVSLGFEIRIEAKAGDADLWAQLTGPEARSLNVQPGDTVCVGRTADATSLPA